MVFELRLEDEWVVFTKERQKGDPGTLSLGLRLQESLEPQGTAVLGELE